MNPQTGISKSRFQYRAVLCGSVVAALLLRAGVAFGQLNENCTVSILNRSVQVRPDGTWVIANIPVNQGLVRARAVCLFSGETRFGQSDLFTVPLNGSVTLKPILFGLVTPIPDSLALTAPMTTLSAPGSTAQLTVTAMYAGGGTADVTSRSAGTTYTSSNVSVATVSADGLVTAVANGRALISAFNEGTSGALSIRVGIPPTIVITSPTSGSSVTEGATIPVTAATTGTAVVVRFLANQQVVFATTQAPFQFNYTVPLAVPTVTLGGQADNGFGDTGIAPDVRVTVNPDPLTTVIGRVMDAAGNPLGGAVVITAAARSGTTASDGSFSIAGVRTALGDIRVTASFTDSGGTILTGLSSAVPPVLGGTTDVGSIILQRFLTRVLVASGINNPTTGFFTDSAEVFDPTTGVWTPTQNRIPNAPSASAAGTCGSNMTALGSGQALFAGGGCSDSGLTTNAASLYDPLTNQWSPTQGMNFGRDQFGMTTSAFTGGAFALAGCSGGCLGPNKLGQFFFSQVGRSTETYNLQSGTWTTLGSLNTARGNFGFGNLFQSVLTLLDGRVLACNGSDGVRTSFFTCEIYTPATNSWAATGSLDTGRHQFALLMDGRVLTIRNDGPGAMLFDPTLGQWQATGSLVTPQLTGRLVVLTDGRALVTGGTDLTGSPVKTAEIFDPAIGTWRLTAPMSAAHAEHVAVLLPDGRVLVAAGRTTGGGLLASAEIFDPRTETWSATGSLSEARQLASAVVLPLAGPPQLTPTACDQESALRSVRDAVATAIQFTNSGTQARKVYSLDVSGQRVLFNTLAPGTSIIQGTYLTHPWVITDSADQCLAIYQPIQGFSRAAVP